MGAAVGARSRHAWGPASQRSQRRRRLGLVVPRVIAPTTFPGVGPASLLTALIRRSLTSAAHSATPPTQPRRPFIHAG